MAGWYATKYKSGDATYGSSLWARSPEDAEAVAKQRGMGETIQSAAGRRPNFERPSRLFYGNHPPLVVLHAVAFLCSIAAKAGILQGASANDDSGLLHETIHYYLFGKDKPLRLASGRRFYSHMGRRNLYKALVALEQATPGYVMPPDRSGEPER